MPAPWLIALSVPCEGPLTIERMIVSPASASEHVSETEPDEPADDGMQGYVSTTDQASASGDSGWDQARG